MKNAGEIMLIQLIRLIRPKHWLKNGFVFAAIIFAGRLANMNALIASLIAFVSFCLLASGMYVVNDILDLESDKKHPVKKLRPLASGKVSIIQATILACMLLFAGLLVAYMVNVGFLIVGLAYILMISLYSYAIKSIVIIDVIVVALGFVLRAIGGAVAIGVAFSPWLVVSTLFLSLFLVIGKRRRELNLLQEDATTHREVLGGYTTEMLNQLLSISASASLISYSLYTLNSGTIEQFGTDKLYITLPFVVFGVFRYYYLIYKKSLGGDPANTLLSDKPLIATIIAWGVTVVGIIYAT